VTERIIITGISKAKTAINALIKRAIKDAIEAEAEQIRAKAFIKHIPKEERKR